jgi:hypothetical protein
MEKAEIFFNWESARRGKEAKSLELKKTVYLR